jgi:hopene-associated glycosyltransferase HpnB
LLDRAGTGGYLHAGMIALALSAVALAIWVYLVFARGLFWLGRERDDTPVIRPAVPPSIAIVVPARNEADSIAASVTTLTAQNYAALHLVLVDDDSDDGTAEVARQAAAAIGAAERLTIVTNTSLPQGWTGKLWAVKQGIAAAEEKFAPKYLLLTDADIVHDADTVSWLVGHAEANGLVLTSLTARWRCENLAERVHIPAFIFFFQMLYPFPWVNRPQSAVAAAAGGCMLVRADVLRRAGGIEVIRGALIDDCALAKALKAHGPIWLGLTERVRSMRPYPAFADIRRMVARSAYAQLRYSPLLLLGTVAGMMVTYLVPPFMAIFGSGATRAIGIGTWGLMAVAFQPTLRLYRLSPLWGFALPAIALQYTLFTLDSAYQYVRGRGGAWKGRVQANVSER